MADSPVVPPVAPGDKQGLRIVVTGSSGKLGKVLADALRADGHSVRGFDKISDDEHTIAGDLNNFGLLKRTCEGAHAICHCAAIASYNRMDIEMFGSNVRGTFNTFLAASQCKVKKLVFASSLAILLDAGIGEPPPPEYLPMDERHPGRCQDIYGVSKLFGEELGRAYSQQHGMSVICLRPHGIDWRPQDALTGPLGEGKVSCWDVVEAFKLALTTDIPYGVYNITGQDWTRITAAKAEKELGWKPRW